MRCYNVHIVDENGVHGDSIVWNEFIPSMMGILERTDNLIITWIIEPTEYRGQLTRTLTFDSVEAADNFWLTFKNLPGTRDADLP